MQLQNEFNSGLQNMKFALNHAYRFDNPWISFLAGFLQASSIAVIEFVNLIVILTAKTYLDVVMNFMALAVIAEFDDAFFTALGTNDELMKLINEPESFEDLYTIQITTSRYANPEVSEATTLVDDTYTEKDPKTG